MEGYIISPLMVYLICQADNLFGFMLMVGIFMGFGCYIGALILWLQYSPLSSEERKLLRVLMILGTIGIILFIIGILFPSSETLLYMLIAKNVTFDKLGIGIETAKDAIDYIVQIVSTMLGK